MQGNRIVGTITSGDWGHRLGKNLAYAFVDVDASGPGHAVEIDMCGTLVSARVTDEAVYDPTFSKLRT